MWRRGAAWVLLVLGGGLLACCGGNTRHDVGNGPPDDSSVAGASSAGSTASSGSGSSSAGAAAAPNAMPCQLSCEVDANGQPLSPMLEIVFRRDEGCPVCQVKPSCQDATCIYGPAGAGGGFRNPTMCPDGYEAKYSPGTCCMGCVRNSEPIAMEPCPQDVCEPRECAFSFILGAAEGQCCPICLADPNYCQTDADCVIAQPAGECCNCPRAISTRLYEADACWSKPGEQRDPAVSCPSVDCSLAFCASCEQPILHPTCTNHTCVAR